MTPARRALVPVICALLTACASARHDHAGAGIEGPRVSVETAEPALRDYLQRLGALIKRQWSYPCVGDPCEYKAGLVVIEFGVLWSGQLAFVEVERSSGFPAMDQRAADAVRAAAPFPMVPPPLAYGRPGTGLPFRINFRYVTEQPASDPVR